jgi:hypothetical protein
MSDPEVLKLEITRPGPLYGQLLSRLTDYLALCDGAEADTVRLTFDHYEVKADLAALRYYLGSSGDSRVPNQLRADAVERLSRRISEMLAQMDAFQTRLGEAGSKSDLVHLRLVLGGSELSLIPFELSTVPSGWRGAGDKLTLQSRAPTVITRELRDSSRIPLAWNRQPRILFCTASPAGFAPPPVEAHLLAITAALRPWVEGGRKGRRPLKIEDVVTVLTDASLAAIEAATSQHEYTHVHLLCHGCPLPNGKERTGIALAQPRAPGALAPVGATGLAGALMRKSCGKQAPTMVVLATCDSANQAGVEAPGASLGYELHQAGVPWVIASQMPLTYRGSAILASTLYHGLFAGKDPRCVLQDVRIQLERQLDSHDWASVVAYASFPADHLAQFRAFRIKQLRRLIDSAFERTREDPSATHRNEEFALIDRHLSSWKAAMAKRHGRNDPEWSEYFGMQGAIAKQKAEFESPVQAKRLLSEAANRYREAAQAQLGNHWVVVQYLSLCRLLGMTAPAGWFELAERSAALDWENPEQEEASVRIWAAGSLMELAILNESSDQAFGRTHVDWAGEVAALAEPGSFEVFSTRRQLQRYTEKAFKDLANETIRKRAAEALARLPESG